MAIKYFCDGCGAELSEEYFRSASSLQFFCNKQHESLRWSDCNFETLCQGCVDEIIKVLKETSERLRNKIGEQNADT